MPGAQAAYSRGLAQEKAKNYGQAIKEYEASITAYPNYYWAYRQMGTCYYLTGDRSKAITAYQRYLYANPKDEKVKVFLNSIEPSKQSPQSTESASTASVLLDSPVNHRFRLALDGSLISLNALDMKKFGGSGNVSSVNGPDSTTNFGLGIGVGYLFLPGLEAFARIGLGPNKSTTFTTPAAPGAQGIVSLTELNFLVGPCYHWFFGRQSVGLGFGIGMAFLSGSYNQTWAAFPQINGGYAMTGSTLVYEPELSYEFSFNNSWSILAGLGYRNARFGSITAGSATGIYQNTPFTNPARYADGSQAFFDNSGPFFRAGVLWN